MPGREKDTVGHIDTEWGVEGDKLCLSERVKEGAMHINELQAQEYEHRVYLHSAKVHCWFSWDDQTLLSCLACTDSLSLSLLFFSCLALPNHPFLFLSLSPFLIPTYPCFFIDAELSVERKTASFQIQIYMLQGKSSLQQLQRPYAYILCLWSNPSSTVVIWLLITVLDMKVS